jgi:type II secretory pathway pseudopilin PulG
MNDSIPPNPDRPPRRRDHPQQISSLQIVFALILSIGLLLVINFSGRIARGQRMETERQRLQATIEVLEQQQVALLKERDYAANDASVEHWAHTEGKMVRDNEILVIPIPAGNSEPTPVPPAPVFVATPAPEPETPRWHLWWNLFFDGEPPF